jgi:hypothetical protein
MKVGDKLVWDNKNCYCVYHIVRIITRRRRKGSNQKITMLEDGMDPMCARNQDLDHIKNCVERGLLRHEEKYCLRRHHFI